MSLPSRSPAPPSVVVLVADGARPDTIARATTPDARGAVESPALARLAAEGALHTVTSCFPSVTGPAYAPFLLGRHPGPIGLPALRWFDRARTACQWPDYTRSYVGWQMGKVDTDLDPAAPTAFELVPESLAALNVIGRGLPAERRLGRLSLASALRAATTHFRGDVGGWLAVDREIVDELTRRLRRDRPRYTFAALTGIDKGSHKETHEGPLAREALGIVDDAVARIRADAEADGRWESMQLWIVSDHGHSAVRAHEDLARVVAELGHRTIAHPWVYAARPEVAVMVSGNAMAHLYLDLARRERPGWPALAPRWTPLVDALLARESVDLVLLPHGPERCEVRAPGRGSAVVTRTAGATAARDRLRYEPLDGDPLALGGPFEGDATEAWEATIDLDHPDALVQIALLAGSARAGDVILSASRGWDFRARWEPIPHVSAHGALLREHMLVPLLTNRPVARTPRRTVDVLPSALAALGVAVPAGVEGESWL
jgi:arylsulfatase A-like enzyme